MPKHEQFIPDKKFLDILKSLDRLSNPLSTFAEMAALSLANGMSLRDAKWKEREQRYLSLVKQHKPNEVEAFCQMLGCLTMLLEQRVHDALGRIYMNEDVVGRSKWDSDVAFTPWEVAYTMAKMQLHDFKIPERGFFTLGEPAAGTGGLVIAAAAVLKDQGINFQQVMHVTAMEIRQNLAHLCYVQLSLLGIPAIVHHGDSLSGQVWSTWYTPMHVMGFWDAKLRRLYAETPPPPPPPPQTDKRGQFTLF